MRSSSAEAVIMPGASIGILGGGQLGRMTAMAARELGYAVRVLDPDPNCAARFLVEEHLQASFDDTEAAARLASQVDVVTLEIEKIALASLDAAARHAPTHPDSRVMGIIQNRAAQKTFYEQHGFPVGPFRVANTEAELAEALKALGGRCFVKVARGGYDGRGQFETTRADQAREAFEALGGEPCVAERALDIEAEISVMVARSARREVACYPAALNHHEERILAWSALPGPMPKTLAARATEIAHTLADTLGIVGLCCVEMFVVKGDLIINEIAPRPHNSYHASVVACATSQFEQHVRAICNLPLGSTDVLRPAAIANLLGDLWQGDKPPPFDRALALPGVRLHLYGKAGARPGRKMGHLSASARTSEQAIEMVKRAQALLAPASK